MEVFDLLTAKDVDYISRYINAYGDYGGYNLGGHVDTQHLLRFWNGAKSGFLASLFGNQLILERRIDIMTPESIILGNIEHSIYPESNGLEFISNYYKMVNEFDYVLYEKMTALVSMDCLAQNVYDGESFELPIEGKRPLQINKGCKVAKILGKIAEEFHLAGYEEFRQKHSMALNQKKFKGTLCLSIHPLDFMTMSDNDSNWDSCMSWRKPGEFREGTVEMMNSPYVIVAYLKHDKDMDLFYNEDAFWNNKRWRELFVISPDVITGIKGYPYKDNILEKEVFKWLMELVKENCPWCHYDPPRLFTPGDMFDYYGDKVNVVFSFNIMYDDFYCDHTGYFSPKILDKRDEHWNTYRIPLSGANVCMCCGKEWDDTSDWDSQSLLCPDCSGDVKCNVCGSFLSENDAITMSDGTYLCKCCAEEYTQRCDYCDELDYNDNTNAIYLEHEEDILMDEVFHLCDDCMCKREHISAYYGTLEVRKHPRHEWFGTIDVINSENLTLNGFNAFGYYARTVEEARKLI